MRRCADPRVDDHGNGGLCDDDGDLFTGGDSFVRTDGGAERHDRGATAFLEALGEDGIGVDVGEDREAFLDEDFSSFESFDGIGKEVGGIGMDLEFDPFREAGGMGEPGESDGFFGVHGSAGVCKQEVFLGIDKIEDIGEGVVFSR